MCREYQVNLVEETNVFPFTIYTIKMNHQIENHLREICWRLPQSIDNRFKSVENDLFNIVQMLPEFLQLLVFDWIGKSNVMINLILFIFIGTISILFVFVVRRSQMTNELRKRCQNFQQEQNRIELECSTLKHLNAKLTKELDEINGKILPNLNDEISDLRENLVQLRAERNAIENELRSERNQNETNQNEFERQRKIIEMLNDEILRYQNLVKRFQSSDLSLERFENDQKLIEELREEIRRFENESSTQFERFEDLRRQIEEIQIEKHELIEYLQENSSIDENHLKIHMEKNRERQRRLYVELEEKGKLIDELNELVRLEVQRRREIEMIVELRERDAQIQLRQIGRFDIQWRQAKTDSERLQIVQRQCEFQQHQMEKMQNDWSNEENRLLEECQKFQNDLHNKSMEIKRLIREIDLSRKESENLRKQIAQQNITNERMNDEKKRLESLIEDLRKSNVSSPSSVHDDRQQDQPFQPIRPMPLFRPPFLPLFIRPPFPINFTPMTPKSPIDHEDQTEGASPPIQIKEKKSKRKSIEKQVA